MIAALSGLTVNTVYASELAGFIDNFDVSITAQHATVAPIITFIPGYHSGGIVAQDYYCDNDQRTCHFEITDNYSGHVGDVGFLIGVTKPDNTLTYCTVVIEDGASMSNAQMTSYSCNPSSTITVTSLYHKDHYHYTFEITDSY